jgi:uncharacterized membrane protein
MSQGTSCQLKNTYNNRSWMTHQTQRTVPPFKDKCSGSVTCWYGSKYQQELFFINLFEHYFEKILEHKSLKIVIKKSQKAKIKVINFFARRKDPDP